MHDAADHLDGLLAEIAGLEPATLTVKPNHDLHCVELLVGEEHVLIAPLEALTTAIALADMAVLVRRREMEECDR